MTEGLRIARSLDQPSAFAGGTARVCTANAPLDGSVPGQAWLVRAGQVDVFAVARAGDGTESARYPLLRLGLGEVMLGLPPHTTQDDVTFSVLLVGSKDGEVVESALAEVLSRKPFGASEIDAWVRTLGQAVFGSTKPAGRHTEAAPGPLLLNAATPLVAPAEALLWARLDTGHALWGGARRRAMAEGAMRPLTEALSLVAEAPAKGTLASTQDLQASQALWPALEAFHRVVAAELPSLLDDRHTRAAARSDQRLEDETAMALAAVARAAEILRDAAQPGGLTEAVLDDPLAAALSTVARALGANPPAFEGEAAPPEKRLAYMVRQAGLSQRSVLLRDAWWTADNGPLVAFHETDRLPVALLWQPGGGYHMFPGPDGAASVAVTEAQAALLAGEAVMLYRRTPDEATDLARLLRMALRGLGGDIWRLLAMGFGTGLLALATPLITGHLVEEVIPKAETSRLLEATLALFCIALGVTAFALVQGIAVLRLEGKIDRVMQSALFARLMALPTGFYRSYTVGDLADRVLGIQKIRMLLTGNTLRALLQGIFSLVSFALLFWINWRLALIATLVVALVAGLIGALTVAQRRAQGEVIRHQGALDGLTVQIVSAIGKLRVAAAENRAYARWLLRLVAQTERARHVQRWVNIIETLNAAIPVALTTVLFLSAAWIMESMAHDAQLQALAVTSGLTETPEEPNLMTTADFLAFNAAFGQFLTGFLGVTLALTNLVEVRPLMERAQPILHGRPDAPLTGRDPGRLSGAVSLRQVVFRYDATAPPVLNDLSLDVAPGEFVALVGPSGSGKSTLVRLLLGFDNPEAGQVAYDGQALGDLDLMSVRAQIGAVLQDGRITPGTVSSNILGASGGSLEDAWTAARLAGLAADIEAMPMGMHTVLVDGAKTLSGGQRQRLMIARALVQQPSLLILDEATSALDNRTQAQVAENLKAMGCTRIMIAHRLSTVIDADRIIVLQDGTVAQLGRYADLIDTPGPFRDLALRQMAT